MGVHRENRRFVDVEREHIKESAIHSTGGIMQKRKLLLAALAVSSIGVIPLTASADVYVTEAPPAPRHEVVPAARHGQVWAPGYWDYRHGHYVWVQGHWEKERHGQYWHPNRWEERDGKWYMERGGWHRD